MGTITLEKGVYCISAYYKFNNAGDTSVRGCHLSNNKGWNGHYIYDLFNATSAGNTTHHTISGVVEVLETTVVSVRGIQSSGKEIGIEAIVDVVKLA